MKAKIFIAGLLAILLNQMSSGQSETYTINKATFSSDRYDEFSPVYYRNGIVFCTNRGNNNFVNYSNSLNKGQLKIFYIDTTKDNNWRSAELLSKSLSSKMNDGPATFSRTFDTIYFSRNLMVEGKLKDINGMSNKLGIFNAVYDGREWDNIQELGFNSEYFNMTTPYLSHDGKKIYFASDRPDGYGGLDIFYSQYKNGYWDDPVNLGPVINTSGNESYPYINEAGELFFSSDGHGGQGGKDIFVTKQRGSGWHPPVNLKAPINSKYDDFSIIADPLMNEGYFSSGRGKTIDIYHFKSNHFHFWFSEPQKENQYCFTISDKESIEFDKQRLQYQWDFGDGIKSIGTKVIHCFPGPGKFSAQLDIVDRRTGKSFFTKLIYNIEIFDNDQPYISSSDDAAAGETIAFDGLKSLCKGYTITGYFWDFGDGTQGKGDRVSHKFNKNGNFDIKLGLTLKSQSSGDISKRVVSKEVRIFKNDQEGASNATMKHDLNQDFPDIFKIENIRVKILYSAENDFKKDAVFHVVLLSSRTRINLNNNIFSKVPEKYSVKEIFNAETGLFNYVVDQQLSLMAAYPAYNEMIDSGYKDAVVRIYVLKEPAERELYTIMKNYCVLTDSIFDVRNKLTTCAYITLDQVVMLLNKYPEIKLEIGVHSDNQGIPSSILWLSKSRAQMITDYLINRGISSNRLTAKGYGDTRPIASNIYSSGRRLNRRIDFTILK